MYTYLRSDDEMCWYISLFLAHKLLNFDVLSAVGSLLFVSGATQRSHPDASFVQPMKRR